MSMKRVLAATILTTASWVALGLSLPSAVHAQEPLGASPVQSPDETASESSEEDEQIIVTGTRIPRPEVDGVLPGVQISAEQIEARGFTNALEALNDIPLVGPGASPLSGNNGGQAASLGNAFVDLLDLGTQRTLTLVNGRRFVTGNAASLFVEGNATGAQVDVNVIPTSLIQRVDVLTVGGAAAYGSDAIAGVVNYILKSDYEGLEARGLAGITSRGDAAQYQAALLFGQNFLDGRGNVVVSAEYTRNDGLQADARDFRLARTASYLNPFNGGNRNPAFVPAIINVTGANNGAFLRNSDDLQPASLFDQGFVNQSLSFNGTVLNTLAAAPTPYVPLTQGTGASLRTSNFITFANGLSPVGFAVTGTTVGGAATTIATPNVGFFATTAQIIQGTPGAGYISGNGLNGRATPIANVPFTTFAPTALIGATAAAQDTYADQVIANFAPTFDRAGKTRAQLNTLALNLLQANRSTAREFFAANPTVNPNYFIGTFVPGVPRIANTDTSLVTVRTNTSGGTAQVPINQVLPFVAVPLEFNPDGTLRNYTFTSGINPNSPLTVGQAQGSNGGFSRSVENIVLRTQQDRFIANLNGTFALNDEITVFTENTYVRILNQSNRNSPSQNFLTNTQENAPLLLNVNNPFLSPQARATLATVGVTPTATNGGNFIVTRQNQDIFDGNPFENESETYRLVGGVRTDFELLGRSFNAELSATYGRVTQDTRATQINDIEYQLALDAVTDPSTGQIRCRAQLFPAQYLGRTPIGTSTNLTRQPGADGLPTEIIVTPTITQDMINACQPLNPFGYNQMSQASKDYVAQEQVFTNTAEQIFLQAFLGGELVQLPAGALAFSAAAEYRREELNFVSTLLNQLGRGRAAPSANTSGFTETFEAGGEARIPITGDDFLPFLGQIEFSPAIRVTKQSGEATTYRTLAGAVVTPTAEGDPETIYSLAGTWRPVPDIQFRGNYTKSIRNPSVVELFLGGQPSFTTPTDFCSTANIDQGLQRVNRRNNCRADVRRLVPGINDDAAADAFLATTFVPNGTGLQGTFAGTPSLQPEKATSWTAGGVLEPRFLPGLSISADYISIDLDNIIIPTQLAQAIQFCYDSPTFNDSTGTVGVNTCGFFSRGADFQVQNGYASGFINLSATELRAVNASARYPLRLGDLGTLTFRGNLYHLITYKSSAAGDFTDAIETAGTFTRPQWEVLASARYENEGYFAQLTWNWSDKTRIFSSGLPATIENFSFTKYPSTNVFDLSVGAEVSEDFRVQFNVRNLTDENYAGDLGFIFQDYVDQIGRRFQVSVVANF